jgi:hypothetical protein
MSAARPVGSLRAIGRSPPAPHGARTRNPMADRYPGSERRPTGNGPGGSDKSENMSSGPRIDSRFGGRGFFPARVAALLFRYPRGGRGGVR